MKECFDVVETISSGVLKKYLGKITAAEFGRDKDYTFLFGLKLSFKLSNGTYVSNGVYNMVNISDGCADRCEAQNKMIADVMKNVDSILKDANVYHISELVGKPVEVLITNNTFIGFRILTEVI